MAMLNNQRVQTAQSLWCNPPRSKFLSKQQFWCCPFGSCPLQTSIFGAWPFEVTTLFPDFRAAKKIAGLRTPENNKKKGTVFNLWLANNNLV
jgi:hypothetical protein